MKLKINTIYGQRDNRWSREFLGYNTSTYTIGSHGCLISSLATYLTATGNELTPFDVNEKLKTNNGFATGGNFIWSKCSALGLSETYVSPSYTGPVTDQGIKKIKELLDGGYPLLCEIDFNPATDGEDMHFILLSGYDGDKIFACDPWTGTAIDLDIYGGPKRAIIKFRAYDKRLPLDDGSSQSDYVKQLEADRLKFWAERDEARKQLVETQGQLDAEKAKSANLDKFIEELAKILNCPKEQSEIVKAINEDFGHYEMVKKLEEDLKVANDNLEESRVTIKAVNHQCEVSLKKIVGLEDALQIAGDENKKLLRSVEEMDLLLKSLNDPIWEMRIAAFLVRIFRLRG